VVNDGRYHLRPDSPALQVAAGSHPPQAPRRLFAAGAGANACLKWVKRRGLGEHRRHANEGADFIYGAEGRSAGLVVTIPGHLVDALVRPKYGLAQWVARWCRDLFDAQFHA
jgi:hypothetical protein